MTWQNLEEKPRGSFVTNVHPCNAGRMPDGVVLGEEDGLGNLSVQTGRGSHVYGPAENWAPVDRAPDWTDEHESGQLRLAVPGEQVSLLPLPDSLIPTTQDEED